MHTGIFGIKRYNNCKLQECQLQGGCNNKTQDSFIYVLYYTWSIYMSQTQNMFTAKKEITVEVLHKLRPGSLYMYGV